MFIDRKQASKIDREKERGWKEREIVWFKVSLGSPGCPETQFIGQAVLQFIYRDPPTSAFSVLGRHHIWLLEYLKTSDIFKHEFGTFEVKGKMLAEIGLDFSSCKFRCS